MTFFFVLLINELLCEKFSPCTQKEFEMSMMRELNLFHVLQIKQGNNAISINQFYYVKDLLKKFGKDNLKLPNHLKNPSI